MTIITIAATIATTIATTYHKVLHCLALIKNQCYINVISFPSCWPFPTEAAWITPILDGSQLGPEAPYHFASVASEGPGMARNGNGLLFTAMALRENL